MPRKTAPKGLPTPKQILDFIQQSGQPVRVGRGEGSRGVGLPQEGPQLRVLVEALLVRHHATPFVCLFMSTIGPDLSVSSVISVRHFLRRSP